MSNVRVSVLRAKISDSSKVKVSLFRGREIRLQAVPTLTKRKVRVGLAHCLIIAVHSTKPLSPLLVRTILGLSCGEGQGLLRILKSFLFQNQSYHPSLLHETKAQPVPLICLRTLMLNHGAHANESSFNTNVSCHS
jgi:hypothetical protein